MTELISQDLFQVMVHVHLMWQAGLSVPIILFPHSETRAEKPLKSESQNKKVHIFFPLFSSKSCTTLSHLPFHRLKTSLVI